MLGKLKKKLLAGEIQIGCWLNLGSPVVAEIVALAGYDWALVDMEHGAGDFAAAVPEIVACERHGASPIVRVACGDPARIKRALDIGPVGLMIPLVNSAEDAARAVQAMRYPPEGIRGVASVTRAARFSTNFKDYFARANHDLLMVAQIETRQAVGNIEDIAAVEGVDVIFVGPLDLTANFGKPYDLEAPDVRDALARIESAAKNAGKILGTVSADPDQARAFIEKGYRFVAVHTDGGMLAKAALERRKMFM